MQGTEKIEAKILEDSQKLIKTNIDDANREAADIIKAAQEQAKQKSLELNNKAKQDAVVKKQRMISVAKLEGRKLRLQAKQEVIEEVFNKAIEQLNNLPTDKYQSILSDMIVNSITDGNEEIILSANDKENLDASFVETINNKLKTKDITGNVKISDITRATNGGFILKLGDIEVNNSFYAIMRMQREELESAVIKVLF